MRKLEHMVTAQQQQIAKLEAQAQEMEQDSMMWVERCKAKARTKIFRDLKEIVE
jgi:hypothetical protein